MDQRVEPQIIIGDEAIQAYKDFERQLEVYRAQLSKYQEEYSQYQAAVSAAYTKVQESGTPLDPDALPVEPERPAVFTRLSSAPAQGYVINLKVGEYNAHLLDVSGQVVPGSTRRIAVIAPIQTNITYKIIPEKQWTKPESSNLRGDLIFLQPREVIYLSPEISNEYRLNDWQRVKNSSKTLFSWRCSNLDSDNKKTAKARACYK